jgi:cytochrome P450
MIQSHLDGNMTKEQLISNTFIFFLALHETTAKSLTWIIQLLSKYPHVQEKARKDVESILQGKDCNYEDISKFDYLSMVIKEAMRLHGPVGKFKEKLQKILYLGIFYSNGWQKLKNNCLMEFNRVLNSKSLNKPISF